MNKIRFLVGLYIVSIIGLFLYSYTQVDLSLTLSRFSYWQVIEKSFQYIGYFQRPLSTSFYLLLLISLFGTFAGLFVAARKQAITLKTVWILIVFTAIVLAFSYNAFSYDLFNYIFDAKIVTYYHLNPYLHRALDFPQDPMLSFMHWTQRTYPYGPIWLFLTVPVSFIGMQVFLPTFYLFKIIASVSYIAMAYGIQKIMKKISPNDTPSALVLFAFQPLIIVETLVSAHNDIVMLALSTWAFYLLLNKKYIWSLLLLALSVGIKFASVVLIPLWLIVGWHFYKKKEVPYIRFILPGVVLSIIAVVIATMRTNFQPWYFLYVLPFGALLPKKQYIVLPYIIFSFFALLQYVPFLYTGNWNPPIPTILSMLSVAGIISSVLTVLFVLFVAKRRHPALQ